MIFAFFSSVARWNTLWHCEFATGFLHPRAESSAVFLECGVSCQFNHQWEKSICKCRLECNRKCVISRTARHFKSENHRMDVVGGTWEQANFQRITGEFDPLFLPLESSATSKVLDGFQEGDGLVDKLLLNVKDSVSGSSKLMPQHMMQQSTIETNKLNQLSRSLTTVTTIITVTKVTAVQFVRIDQRSRVCRPNFCRWVCPLRLNTWNSRTTKITMYGYPNPHRGY